MADYSGAYNGYTPPEDAYAAHRRIDKIDERLKAVEEKLNQPARSPFIGTITTATTGTVQAAPKWATDRISNLETELEMALNENDRLLALVYKIRDTVKGE